MGAAPTFRMFRLASPPIPPDRPEAKEWLEARALPEEDDLMLGASNGLR